MKAIVHRLVIHLADPSLSEREFQRLAKWLAAGGIHECLEAAYNLRRTMRHLPTPPYARESSPSDEIELETRRLLIDEAGLTVHEALSRLARRVHSKRRIQPRMSFARGISQLKIEAGGGRLMNAAQEIRNKLVHDSSSTHWPLKERGDVGSRETTD